MRYDKTLYNVALFWGSVAEFTSILDTANEKYNGARWRQFAYWGRRLNTPEYRVNVRKSNLNVAAGVLAVNGEKPPRSVKGWSQYGGTIPLIGHSFIFGAEDFMMLRSFEPVDGDPNYHARYEYITRFSENVGGMHVRINMFVFQALSTGYILVNAENNPEGVTVLFDMKYNPEHRLVPAKPWSDPTADPIQDLYDAQDAMTDDEVPFTNWVMSKKLIRELAAHPNVRTRLIQKMYPYATVDPSAPGALTRKEVILGLEQYFEIMPIIEIDEKSAINKDGRDVEVKSFDETIAVLVDPTRFFELQNCRNIYEDDNNPNITNTMIEDGHFSVIVEYFSNPAKNTTSMEAFVIPVPRNPKNIALLKTDATGAWGDFDSLMDSIEITDDMGYKTALAASRTGGANGPQGAPAQAKASAPAPVTEVNVNGLMYAPALVVAALKGMGVSINSNTGAAKTQAAVDALTDEQKASLHTALTAPVDETGGANGSGNGGGQE